MTDSNLCKYPYFIQERTITQEDSKLSYMKKTLGEEIRNRRKELKLRQEDVAKAIGVNRVAISQWERDETQPNGIHLIRLERELGISVSLIIDGICSSVKEDKNNYLTKNTFDFIVIEKYQINQKTISLNNAYIHAKGSFPCPIEIIKNIGSQPNNLRVLFINNDSMSPTISKNTMLFVDINDTEMQSGLVYLINWYGEERIKRAFKDGKNSFKLKSDNQHNALYIDDWVDLTNNDDVKVLGRIVWQASNL